MPGAKTTKRTLEIWKLYSQGVSIVHIAEKLSLKPNSVNAAVVRGFVKGVVTKRKAASGMRPALKRMGLQTGSVRDIFDGLDEDQRNWLMDEVMGMGCETIAEYLLEQIRDAYEESKDEESKDE